MESWTLLIGSWKSIRTYHNFRPKNLSWFLSHRSPHIPMHPQHCEIDSKTMEQHPFKKKLKTRQVDNSCPPIYTYKKPHLACEPLVVALACQGPWYELNAPESWSWPQFSTSSLP